MFNFFFFFFFPILPILFPSLYTLVQKNKQTNPKPNPSSLMVGVMNALSRSNWEPTAIRTIVINHMLSSNPKQLMALMQIQLWHCWLIPPILLLSIAAALPSNLRRRYRRWALAAVDLKPFVRRYEGCVRPICLHPTTLRGPVIGVPYWAVYAHRLVLGKGYASVLHICMNSYWGFIHKEADQNTLIN